MPTPQQVIGINLGDRDVTTAESDAYVKAVDAASPRVTSGSLAKSVQGRDLTFAIVGSPDRSVAAPHDPVRLVVTAAGERAAAAVIARQGVTGSIVRTPGRASFTIPNPGGLGGDELPWTRTLAAELQRSGVPVVMYQVP